MKGTLRLTGLADYITLGNGLLGTCAIFFLILAVDDLNNPYTAGVRSKYIWASMLCIFLSAIGDIIDGPVARRYSKRKLLGGSLDIMSDCVSFCVAPALMMFIMFGRWDGSNPLWTVALAIVCCWVIAAGMLRLARFQYEEASELPYFHGLSSPGNAMMLMSFGGLIWLQPTMGIGPELTTANMCTGVCHANPALDVLILPVMLISGMMMISDRRLSKLKHGIDTKLSILQMLCLLIGIVANLTITSTNATAATTDFGYAGWLFLGSALFCIYYIVKPQPPAVEADATVVEPTPPQAMA